MASEGQEALNARGEEPDPTARRAAENALLAAVAATREKQLSRTPSLAGDLTAVPNDEFNSDIGENQVPAEDRGAFAQKAGR